LEKEASINKKENITLRGYFDIKAQLLLNDPDYEIQWELCDYPYKFELQQLEAIASSILAVLKISI
jgi:hypothetical protein